MKLSILGYNTKNLGDDIQSFVMSTLIKPDYVINRDDYDEIYNYSDKQRVSNLTEKTLLIMNGWFMHSINRNYTSYNNIKFPIKNPLIRPYYVSTCLSKNAIIKLFSSECVENYMDNPPFLCRDMFTKQQLDMRQIPNEYYGCATQLLSINDVPESIEAKEQYENTTIYVDVDKNHFRYPSTIKENHRFVTHYINALSTMNPVDRLSLALSTLQKYKYAKKIITTRLHCFLPCRAMGLDVDYVGPLNWRTQDLLKPISSTQKENMKNLFYDYLDELTKNA